MASRAVDRCTRRAFLGASLSAALIGRERIVWGSETADVPWLAEVQRPPLGDSPAESTLRPLLKRPDGSVIQTRSAWEEERRRIRDAWMKFLGPMPAERPPVRLEVLNEDRPEGCVRQLVRYESEPGQFVEGYLLRPATPSTTPRAGIVALHPTNQTSIEEIAGVNGAERNHSGLRLCRRGFVVFCPRCYLWQTPPGYRIETKQTVADFRARHPETLGMHKMLYDAQRAVDVLVSRDEVDPRRIGAFGHSLGAKEALYLAAFDERVRTAVASEGGIGFRFTNWDASWYLGPAIHEPGFPRDHHELLALIAPRAFLILAGEQGRGAADGDRSWPYVEAALPVYRLYGGRARIGLYNHGEGHTVSENSWRRIVEWLETYLAAG